MESREGVLSVGMGRDVETELGGLGGVGRDGLWLENAP